MPERPEAKGPQDDLAQGSATSTEVAPLLKHTIFDTPVLRSVLRFASLIFLKAVGWKCGGQWPQADKCVLIAAPHTSNFDYILLMTIAYRFRLKIYWMGKNALFKHPFKTMVRYCGGIAIDRSKNTGMVAQTIELFHQNDQLIVTIPVEGTRGKTKGWKSGFYHIAYGADVPVVLGYLDYDKKIGGFGGELHLTGDMDADMAILADFYADIGAKYPDKKTEPRLSS